jgi:hypothetical protein
MWPMIDATRLAPIPLNDKERAQARTARERAVAEAFAQMGVSPAEAALFNVIHYGLTNSPDVLPSTAASPDYALAGPSTEEERRDGLAACLARGWLQVIDEPARARIAAELRDGGFLGPIYGLPDIGGVDFTLAGAELWRRISRLWLSDRAVPFAYTDTVHIKTAQYFRTRAAAVAAMPTGDEDHAVTATGPIRIGPWRVQWWRRFPEGYRIDIEERMQWQGRCGGDGEQCFLARPQQELDPQRLRHVLDCHDLTLAEWLLLTAVEDGWDGPATDPARRIAWEAHHQFGVRLSEAECHAGLWACLRRGLLRIVDEQAVEEVRALLRNDPVVLPVPTRVERQPGEIDFTPDGADLYLRIAAEWLGPDWEDALNVRNDYYWEVHHYCEAEEGLQGLVEHAPRGYVVRASKLAPIGPWCVYWWERFPAGYRLEIQISEPLQVAPIISPLG